MPAIRVLIIEDSAVVRSLLEHTIKRDPRLEVAASVASAEEGIRLLPTLRPDIISMDIHLPGMDGLAATQRIMVEQPTPIVIVSSAVSSEAATSLDALRAGALAVEEKPVGPAHPDFEPWARRLTNKLAIMSEVKVVRQRADRAWRPLAGASAAAAPADGVAPPPADPAPAPAGPFRYLAVVASTGGPQALARLLGDLGPRFPLPVLLVQHITAAFTDSFVAWLDGVTPLSVTTARDGEAPRPGRVYVAPAGRHLRLTGAGTLRTDDGPPVDGQRPSGTVLFESLARARGAATIGVLLTGMGDDGADGLLALRSRGGHTVAEDASTAVVYGMPGAAVARGAARESLPLQSIGPRVWELVSPGARAAAAGAVPAEGGAA